MNAHTDQNPTSVHTPARLMRVVGTTVLAWAGFVTFYTMVAAVDRTRAGAQVDYLATLHAWAAGMAPWLFLLPICYFLARRHVLENHTLGRQVLETLALGISCWAFISAFILTIGTYVLGLNGAALLASATLGGWLGDGAMLVFAVLAGRLVALREREREKDAQARKLERHLSDLKTQQAQLETKYLRRRFSSHFVQNALGNVLGLVRAGDEARAEEAILSLSRILRRAVEEADDTVVPLNDEFAFTADYIAFQTIRYPSLEYSVDTEERALALPFPPQVLQQLVENAVKHGMGSEGKLTIRVETAIKDNQLMLSVTNSLPKDAIADTTTENEGLQIIKARLDLAFGSDTRLRREADAQFYSVTITTPMSVSTA